MKRKEETAIILSALATAGVPESNQVKSAVDYGLKLIRIRKFEERAEPKEGLPMLEKWTGDLIGKMHNSKVTYDEAQGEGGLTMCKLGIVSAKVEILGSYAIVDATGEAKAVALFIKELGLADNVGAKTLSLVKEAQTEKEE